MTATTLPAPPADPAGAAHRAIGVDADEIVGAHSRLRRAAGHLALGSLALALASIFPIYWMYATSLRPEDRIFDRSLVPLPATLDNYRYVLDTIPIGRMLLNTAVMASLIALGQLLTSLFAAYAFARWRFRGERLLFLAFVGTWLVPFQVTMIPNYVLISRLGWLNSLAGLVVPQLSSAFAVILLRQHLKAFPTELLDAARMDGRSSWSTLWTVVVPNLRAPLAALGILLFVSAWNDYFWPLLVIRGGDSVVQIGIRSFLSAEGDHCGAVMAASGLACLPIFLLYVVLQRHVIDAFVQSGIK